MLVAKSNALVSVNNRKLKDIRDAVAPYLFAINAAESGGLAVLLRITRR